MKIRLHIFTLLLTLLLSANAAWAQTGNWTDDIKAENPEKFSGGDGTQGAPYLIASPKDLAYLAKQVNAATNDAARFQGKYFKQTADIDLSAHYWTAIGYDATHFFLGNYDGQGYSITGMKIAQDASTASTGYGLFGAVGQGTISSTIKNVVLKNSSITLNNAGTKELRTGMLIGAMANNTSLLNSSAIGCTITINGMAETLNNRHTGGLVGDIAYSFGTYSNEVVATISNCYSNVNISIPAAYKVTNAYQTEAAGIVGRIRRGKATLPKNCYYQGTITAPCAVVSPYYGTCRYNSPSAQNNIPEYYTQNDIVKNATGVTQQTAEQLKAYFGDYTVNGTKVATDLSNLVKNTNKPASGYTYYSLAQYVQNGITMPMVQGVNVGAYKSLDDMLTILNENVTTGNGYVTWYKLDEGLRPSVQGLFYDSDANKAELVGVPSSAKIVWYFNNEEITGASGVGKLSYTLTEEQLKTAGGVLKAEVYETESATAHTDYEIAINSVPDANSITAITLNATHDAATVNMPKGYEDVAPLLYYQWMINGSVVKEGTDLQTYELTELNKAALNAELTVRVYKNADDAAAAKDALTKADAPELTKPFNDATDYFYLAISEDQQTLSVKAKEGAPAVFATLPNSNSVYSVSSVAWTFDGQPYTSTFPDQCNAANFGIYTWTITITPKPGQPAYLKPITYICEYAKGTVVFIDPVGTYGGDNANDGLSAETPVKQMWRAYEVLRVENAKYGLVNPSMEANTIVLMSNYKGSNDDCRSSDDKKTVDNGVESAYFNYYKNLPAFWAGNNVGLKKLCNDVNCTITGSFAGVNYKPTFKLPNNGDAGIYLSADTKFENLTFGYITPGGNEYGIFACGYNLTFGRGLQMDVSDLSIDKSNSTHFYPVDGWRTCRFEVTMGFNVSRVAWGTKDAAGNYVSPTENRYVYKDRDGNEQVYPGFDKDHPAKLVIQSGNIGRILGTCRSIDASDTDASRPDKRVFASKKFPFYVNILIDIPKEEQKVREAKGQQSDVGSLILGQADGSCFSHGTVTVKRGRIGRIVGGNLGWSDAQTATPKNSYFGTSEINIEEDVEINEVYGGTLGRAGLSGIMAYPTYYGHIRINMTGGTVNKLFAVGAGGITGYSDKSSDPKAKTWGKVFMGDETTDVVVNMTGGIIGDAIYGGGYGESNILDSNQHPRDAGTLYGNSTINILGGVIKGNVYAAGSGTDNIFFKRYQNLNKDSLNSIAQFYGTTRLTIGGNAEVQGSVFGGGMGIQGAPEMARLFGTSEVHIQDDATVKGSVYGGGALSSITGSTGVFITGNPIIENNVFGGGQGSTTQQAKIVATPDINDGESISKVYVSGGKFIYQSDNLTKANNCIFGGGDVNCFVNQSDVRVTASMVPVVLNVSEAQYAALSNNISNARFHLFGGGLGQFTHTASTNVYLDLPITAKYPAGERGYINVFGGGFEGTATKTHVQIGDTDNPFEHANQLSYVFGGGFNANVGTGKVTDNADGTKTYADLTGETNVNIYNASADVLYGGGYLGEVLGDAHLNIYGAQFTSAYGGGEAASVRGNATTVLNRQIKPATTEGGTDDVFSPIDIHYAGAIFGGGHGNDANAADVNGTATTKVYGSYYTFSEKEASKTDGTVPLYSIYGGCNYKGTVGNTDVYIHINDINEAHHYQDAAGIERTEQVNAMPEAAWNLYYGRDEVSPLANIYGGGFGEKTVVSGNTRVEVPHLGSFNYKNIFGGGLQGEVKGNTSIIFGESGQTYTDETRLTCNRVRNIYGGGLNANVGGSTDVLLLSGNVRSVFGGGRSGNVGTSTTVRTLNPEEVDDTNNKGTLDLTLHGEIYGGCERADVGGSSTVSLAGGVHLIRTDYADGTTSGGNVFGGGRGLLNLEDPTQNQSADIVKSDVSIVGPTSIDKPWRVRIDGDVYGGGNLACRTQSSYVRVKGVYGDMKQDIEDVVNQTETGEGDGKIIDFDQRRNLWLKRLTNVYGGGLGLMTSTNQTYVCIGELGQTVSTLVGNVFGGGEGGDIGNTASTEAGYPYTAFEKGQTSDAQTTQKNLGRTQVYVLPGSVIGLNLYGGCNKSSVYGHTRVSMLGGTIGTDETVLLDYGNYFGGSNTGYVYGNTTAVVGRSFYKKSGEFYTFLSPEEFHALPEGSKRGYVDCDFMEDGGGQNALVYYCADITIKNALFGGGNVSNGTTADDKKVYANTETVIGNSHIYITDDEQSDYIVISSDGTGGLYGDGNLVLTRGYRDVCLTSYGSQYHTLPSDLTIAEYNKLNDRVKAYYNLMYKRNGEDKYITEDEWKKLTEGEKGLYTLTNHCQLKAGRMLNTLQRADNVTLRNTRMVMLGAPDKVPEVVDYTNYSVNRVDSITCISKSDDFFVKENKGNFFGIYNVTNLLGSMQSDVLMSDTRLDQDGDKDIEGKSYFTFKNENKNKPTRNRATSPNEVAIANGAWLVIEHLQGGGEGREYGRVDGVFQLSLLASSTGEGGGYVYAKNIHGEDDNHESLQDPEQIETSGNFVHPSIHVVDDCFPATGDVTAAGHYWYLKGDIYVYNVKVSAFTGTSQAYSVDILLPMLQLDAAMAGKLKIANIQDNYYCAVAGEYNNKQYALNEPIDAYEYGKLKEAERANFARMTYVKKTADFNNLKTGDVITSTAYDALSDTEKENYYITNSIATQTGFALTAHMDNPKEFTYQVKDGSKDEVEPKFFFRGEAATVLGQRHYEEGTFHPSALNDIADNVLAHFKEGSTGDYTQIESCNSLAVFEKAYITTEVISNAYYTADGELINFMQRGAGIGKSQYDYNEAKGLNDKVEPAYICTQTLKLSDTKIYPTGEVIGETEYKALSAKQQNNFVEAIICTRKGDWGGTLFEPGKEYAITEYSDISQAERDAYQFDYNFGQLNMLDLQRPYDFKYKDLTDADAKPNYTGHTNCYNKEHLIDFTATCRTPFTASSGKSYDVGAVATEAEFDALENEKIHFYLCYFTTAGTQYVCNAPRIAEGEGNSIGTVIDRTTYDALSADEKARYMEQTVEAAGTYAFTIEAGGYSSKQAGHFDENTLYSNKGEAYMSLVDEKQNFKLTGTNPTAAFNFYVSADATFNTLRTNRIVTLELQYKYDEYDADAGGYTPVTERYIVNVEIEFKSGAPTIGNIAPLPKIIPGSTISLQQPLLTQGAYVIESTGWEISTDEKFLTYEECSPNTPVYWYQDGYYVRFYAITYLGKAASSPTKINVANYHRMNDVWTRKNNMFVVNGAQIYIDGAKELNEFHDYFDKCSTDADFYDQRDGLNNVFNPKHCAGLNFHMQSNVDMNDWKTVSGKATWTPVGTTEHPFQANFNGNGARISNLVVNETTNQPAGFFGQIDGSVISNLGVQGTVTGTGTYAGGIVGCVDKFMEKSTSCVENSWFMGQVTGATNCGAIMGGSLTSFPHFANCYYNSDSSEEGRADGDVSGYGQGTDAQTQGGGYGIFYKTKKQFADGKVAYFLNGYYLNRRLDVKMQQALGDPSIDQHHDRYDFVQNAIFVEADRNVSKPWDWTFIRTYHEPGQYNSGSAYYDASLSHGADNNEPFYDPTNAIAYTEYIMFGQNIDIPDEPDVQPGGEKLPGICNFPYTNYSNGVYRAAAYRGNKTPEGFYYNLDARVWESDITAIDFTGQAEMGNTYWDDNTLEYNDPQYLNSDNNFYYPPLNDPAPLASFKAYHQKGMTKNLLVYASTVRENPAGQTSYEVVQSGLNYTTETPAYRINGHAVSYNKMDEETGGTYVANLLHLVDDESFNAPIAFTATKAWYDYLPTSYVNAGNDAWEAIALPFTATSVEAYVPKANGDMTHADALSTDHGFSYTAAVTDLPSYGNGALTHFYGKANTNYDDCPNAIAAGTDDAHNVGHQYWLRTADQLAKGTAHDTILFSRPTEDDALYARYAVSADTTYSPTCEWYWRGATEATTYSMENYPFLTAYLPYIVSFPGKRYYEFDLSGAYSKVDVIGPQAITFAAADVPVAVTDDATCKQSLTESVVFAPNFLKRAALDSKTQQEMVVNESGTAFVAATGQVHPFRSVLTVPKPAASEPSQHRSGARTVYIGQSKAAMQDDLMPGAPDEESAADDATARLTIQVIGHQVVVTSPTAMQLPLYAASGILLARWDLTEGKNVFTITEPGIYILGTTKLLIRP